MKTLVSARENEVGATAIEYGLIAALISVVIITSVQLVGTDLNAVFQRVASGLSGALTNS